MQPSNPQTSQTFKLSNQPQTSNLKHSLFAQRPAAVTMLSFPDIDLQAKAN